nr:hypothetical protein [Tanacetum cinerariifolium]
MRDSNAYKTYIAYAAGAASPKMKRKFKKPASPLKKRALVNVEEEEPEPAMKVAQVKKALKRSQRETTIHQVGGSDDGTSSKLGVSDEPKGKSIDTSEGTSLKPGVLDVSKADSFKSKYESWGDSDNDNDDVDQQSDDERKKSIMMKKLLISIRLMMKKTMTLYILSKTIKYESWGDSDEDNDDDDQSDDERTESDNPSSSDDEEETHEDEYVLTPKDYVPTDDETNDESKGVDEEEYERIQRELYDDVNVRLTYAEKGDEDMTHAEQVNVEHKEVSQDVTGDQIKDDAQTAVTAALTTKKTALFERMTKSKSFNKIPKNRAMYHALMQCFEDENAMDKGVADQLKKRKSNDAHKDEGPSARLYQELTRQKTSKDSKPSKKAKLTETSKGASKSQPKSTGKSAQTVETVFKAGDTISSLYLISTIISEVPNAVKEFLGTNLDDALLRCSRNMMLVSLRNS